LLNTHFTASLDTSRKISTVTPPSHRRQLHLASEFDFFCGKAALLDYQKAP